MLTPEKLSSKITREALLPGDKLTIIRRALDEADPAKRVTPATQQAVATALTPLLGGPNLTPGGPFFVTCRDVNTVGYNDGISILANIADANICFGCTATTHFSPDGPNSVYIASYDVTGPLRINKDGFFGADRNIPARWVLQDSLANARANVRAWTAVINDWKLGEVLTHTIGTVEGFYRTKFAGGPRAAPTGPEDLNYKQTAPPIAVAAVFARNTRDEALLLIEAGAVVANRLYCLKMPGGSFVYVHGLDATTFDGRGAVADPANLERGIPVDIDVRAGTVTAVSGGGAGVALLWQAGGVGGTQGYLAGQQLYNSEGVDFRPLNAIANPQAEPFLTTSTAAANALYKRISPNLYTATGQNSDGAMTQKATSDILVAATAPIQARFNTGVQTPYATAQLAATALFNGGGGTIVSEVDIEGPLTLSGNVSLFAPGRTVFLRQNITGDTLTLSNCTGSVECRLIERTIDGFGYALRVNGGSPTVRADVVNTRGYNAIFSNGATLSFTGNSTLTNNVALAGGERLAVLAVGGSLIYRGGITLNSADAVTNVTEGLTGFSGATVDFDGLIRVTNKGRAARNQAGTMRLRGAILTKDQGLSLVNGQTDIYASIDTREAVSPTTANAPLVASTTGGTGAAGNYITLHVGTELLAPPGVVSIFNSNPAVTGLTVQVAGALAQNAMQDTNVSIVQLTLPANNTFAVLPYVAAGIPLDFNAATVQTLAATGNVVLTTANRAALKTKQVTITNTTGAAITISYEAWVYFGPAPITSLPAGKRIKLVISCLGPAISDVEAANSLSA